MNKTCIYLGEALARYGFGQGHPFGHDRQAAFARAFYAQGLDQRVTVQTPAMATPEEIGWFHDPAYVEFVKARSAAGSGFLDYGDTPAFPGVFEAAACVVGSTLDGVRRILRGDCTQVFVPIAGLHHAARDWAAGFCVFNDCGVAIEALLREGGLKRVAYVDIDAHHGDGVFYAFVDHPGVVVADIHQDGRTLYPGTGQASETGTGQAAGTKLNIPLSPGAGDAEFLRAWDQVEAFMDQHAPQFILLQCGADSLADDPITSLAYTEAAHRHAASRLRVLAERHCQGRLLAMGGGGYNRDNIARGWTAVVEALAA